MKFNTSQERNRISTNPLKNPLPIVVLLSVFFLGIFLGKWQEQRAVGSQKATTTHGSVLHLEDLPFRSTSHMDAQGRPFRKKQFIDPFYIPNMSGFQVASFQPGQEVETHQHKTMHEVFYVLSGKGTFTVNGVKHSVTSGTMVHVAPQEKHSILAEESTDGDLVLAWFGVTVD